MDGDQKVFTVLIVAAAIALTGIIAGVAIMSDRQDDRQQASYRTCLGKGHAPVDCKRLN